MPFRVQDSRAKVMSPKQNVNSPRMPPDQKVNKAEELTNLSLNIGLCFVTAKIGGWLGLAIGASVFSFVEIFLFILVQIRLLIKNFCCLCLFKQNSA